MPTAPPPPLPRLDGEPWLAQEGLRAVLAALAAGGHEARIVGGAVRNALFARPVADIDLATPARPEEVIRLARQAGLTAVPTGLEHGTVTVVASHTPYEVTTLRRDIETFGRHARVTFTTDWAEDAARRDFTINALYCTADGRVDDPLGGWPDVVARRVRFIGAARDRIREDYLRILRFFRFSAEYAAAEPDPDGLAASVSDLAGIDGLSGERLRAEMTKLLAAPRAVPVLATMASTGILERVTGLPADVAVHARLAAIERSLARPPDAMLALAALYVRSAAGAQTLRERLKLSNAEAATLALATVPFPAPGLAAGAPSDLIHLYRSGTEAFMQSAMLAWARSDRPVDDPGWRARLEAAARLTPPVLPVRGADVVALGVAAGPEVGRALRDFEDWWIAAGFPDDAVLVAARLRSIVAAIGGDHAS